MLYTGLHKIHKFPTVNWWPVLFWYEEQMDCNGRIIASCIDTVLWSLIKIKYVHMYQSYVYNPVSWGGEWDTAAWSWHYEKASHEPLSEARVIHGNLDWQSQSVEVIGVPTGYKRALRENVISFRLSDRRCIGITEVWQRDAVSRSILREPGYILSLDVPFRSGSHGVDAMWMLIPTTPYWTNAC